MCCSLRAFAEPSGPRFPLFHLFPLPALCAVLSVLVAAGCSDASGPEADAGGRLDAPGAIDAGASDAFRADAALELDAGMSTDAPPEADTPSPSDDAGSPADAPVVIVDAGPPAAEGCFPSVASGHHVFSCDSIAYDVEISTACATGGCGLVLDVHGATMDAANEDLNTNLRALGAARGYVVVQPTAPSAAFGPSWDPARDDPRVFAFVELTMRAMRVDRDRVHFTGFSQGGFMSWRMLCAHADVFASVAPAAACGALFPHCPFTASARPSREIPVLYMHGRNDPIVSGCQTAQRDAVVGGWSMTLDATVSMDGSHTWSRYRSPSGNVFEYITHDYRAFSTLVGGHCFPGSPDIGTNPFGTTGFGCDDTVAFDWGESVIAFFEAHPRR